MLALMSIYGTEPSRFRNRTARRLPFRLMLLAGVAVASVAWPAPSLAAEKPEATLTAAKGSPDAKFGTAVSLSGDTAVVGAPDEGGTDDGGGMGAAYVFDRINGVWTERATLVAPVRRDGDKFGFSVAVDRNTVIVGAPNADEQLPGPGMAYVFVRSGPAWVHQATLKPSERKADDAFGFRVAVSGDTAIVGADGGNIRPGTGPGAAYVFTRTGSTWTEQAKLAPRDAGSADGFGFSVGISDDTAVVGALTDVGNVGLRPGSVYVFTRTGSSWTEQARLVAADGVPGDALGISVSISRDTVVAGAGQDQVGLNPLQGSAYVFVRSGKSWTQQAKLTAPAAHGHAREMFGRSVATTGDTVAVGSHFDEPGGSVYVFHRVASDWSQPTRHTAPGTGLLGLSIGLSGRTVIGGANFTKVGNNENQGAAYVFRT
jgi:hypothetical protein